MKTISLAILATLFAIPVHAQCLQNLPAGSRVQIHQRKALLPWNAGQDVCIQVPQQPEQGPGAEILRAQIQMKILEAVQQQQQKQELQQLLLQQIVQQRIQQLPQVQPVQPQVFVIPQGYAQGYVQPISSRPIYYRR